MMTSYLFPHSYKRIGWILFVPTAVFFILWLTGVVGDVEFPLPKVFRFYGFAGSTTALQTTILPVVLIAALLFIGFSREEDEDEYVARIRMESLIWSLYVNYFLLALAFLLVYGTSFLGVTWVGLFTLPLFFVFRLQWKLYLTRKLARDEK
ncbi:hypothetical protein [uncultured Acetobacteroides sp.]|uniref:hypothetical protein n=1 Tax=uncultured Acetobacteroides sp. TaxID=1760811 RepID=UPI0029F558CD|nr:hypothetical protein [uncultured Acetobacteroides sp.]